MNASDEIDVVVVGAGLSGLAAARRLTAAGRRVVVLEAAEEIGGRTRSERVGSGVANLGAEWVGSRHLRVRALCRELGLELEPTRLLGARVRWRLEDVDRTARIPPLRAREALALAGALRAAHRIGRRLDPQRPWMSRGATGLDSVSLGAWVRERGVDGRAYALLDTFVGDLVSAPIAELSLLHVLWWVARNGGIVVAIRSAFEARIGTGSGALARGMAASLGGRVVTEAPVEAIEQSGGEVALHTGGREVRARRAIAAIPAPRLVDIGFDPQLPGDVGRVARELRIGAACKVVATVESAAGLPRVVVGGERLSGAWRYGTNLTGFLRPPHDLLGEADTVAELATAFALRPRALREVQVVRWGRERRIGGCDVCFMPGQLTALGPALARGHGAIEFAGPERSSWPNNMEGALESGERAAAACLAA